MMKQRDYDERAVSCHCSEEITEATLVNLLDCLFPQTLINEETLNKERKRKIKNILRTTGARCGWNSMYEVL